MNGLTGMDKTLAFVGKYIQVGLTGAYDMS